MPNEQEISKAAERKPAEENIIQHIWHEIFPTSQTRHEMNEKAKSAGSEDYLPNFSIADDASVAKKMAATDDYNAAREKKIAGADSYSAEVEKKMAD